MPKRTNLFQEIVEIIHRHMAENARVEASALLPSRTTGKLREVDVAIRARHAGYEVIVCVEAVARSRKANREWVDQMVGKHADLPTSKLVLVSEKGFTKDAREAALAQDAVPLAPDDLSGGDPARAVVGGIPSLWPKVISFQPETVSVNFAEDAPKQGWERDPPIVATEGDGVIGDIWDIVKQAYHDHFRELMEQIGMANIKENETRSVKLVLAPKEGNALQMGVNGETKTIYLVNANGQGYSVREIIVKATAKIEVSEIPLTHGRLGDVEVRFAYGQGKVGDRDALLVASAREGDEEGLLTIRVRPQEQSEDSGEVVQADAQ